MNTLRLLNFDDLFMLRLLSEGHSLTNIARELKLTQPAISQRLKKMESVFKISLVEKRGRDLVLTKEGQAVCKKAVDALTLMGELGSDNAPITINVGTRPEAGRTWLWPAILAVRKTHPDIRFHINFGSGSEILAQLGVGKLDVVLTSAPVTVQHFRSIELLTESYSFVASPLVAKKIKTTSDLENYVFIEHDRSFPFLRYVDAKQKSKIKFKDIWFIESTEIMASAIAAGEGVGIIPSYIANRFLKKGELSPIDLKLNIATDGFRLVYRADRHLCEEIHVLADNLIEIGLK